MLIFLAFMILSSGEFRVPYTFTAPRKALYEAVLKFSAPKLEIRPCEKDTCAYAKEDIKVEEPIVFLNESIILTDLDSTPFKLPDDPIETRLHMNLVYYKFMDNSTSFINAMVHSLPIDMHGSMNWSVSDFELYDLLSLEKRKIQHYFNHTEFCQKIQQTFKDKRHEFPGEIFECETWKWAGLIVQSRGFGLDMNKLRSIGLYKDKKEKEKLSKSILPFVDMLNHDSYRKGDNKNTFYYYYPNPPKVEYVALRKFDKGNEVFNYYFALNSFLSASEYGFVMQNNYDDGIEVLDRNNVICRGTETTEGCLYKLNVLKVSRDLLFSINDHKTKGYPSHMLIAATNSFVSKSDLKGTNVLDYNILDYSCRQYRQLLISKYSEDDLLSLREIRRKYSDQSTINKELIVSLAETQRIVYYELLKHIDRQYLFLHFNSLFNK